MNKIMKQPFFKLFMKKRKSRGTLWASLLGIGVSAAVFGMKRGKGKETTVPFQNMVKNFSPKTNLGTGKGKEMAVPFQNIMKNFSPKTNLNLMDDAALAEFSEELMSSALSKNKNNNETNE